MAARDNVGPWEPRRGVPCFTLSRGYRGERMDPMDKPFQGTDSPDYARRVILKRLDELKAAGNTDIPANEDKLEYEALTTFARQHGWIA